MARIRTIKPEFFTSEDIVSLTPLARLFYIALWCEADREGRLEWKPRTLKMRYLPADDVDTQALGEELAARGVIVMYESGGVEYAYIPGFTKHQVINNREAKSDIPPPPRVDVNERRASRVPRTVRELDGLDLADLLTRESGVGTRESGRKEGKEGKERNSAEPQSDSTPSTSAPPPVVCIPLNDGSEHGVTEAQVAEWSATYPAVDVRQQLLRMRAWCMANPARRKTRRGVAAFIVRWLGEQQDRGPQRRAAVADDVFAGAK